MGYVSDRSLEIKREASRSLDFFILFYFCGGGGGGGLVVSEFRFFSKLFRREFFNSVAI